MVDDSCHIRLSAVSDLPRLREIYCAARDGAGCYPTEKVSLQEMQKMIEGEVVLLACNGSGIAGFVSVWLASNFIHHLYVRPDEQSRGIGSALIRSCVERFGLPLSLKCDQCNRKARAFYQRRGWVKQDEGTGEFGPWDYLYLTNDAWNLHES